MSQQVYFHSESIHFSGFNICLASENGISLDCYYVLDAHDNYLDQHFQPYVQGHPLARHMSLPMPNEQVFSANRGSSENVRIGPRRYRDTNGRGSGHRFPPRYHATNGRRSGHGFPQRYPDTNGNRSGHRFPPRYHDTTGGRSGHRFPHPPRQHHSFHRHVQPAQVIRGHSFNIHPPVIAPSYRFPTNPSHSSSIVIYDAFEMGAGHPGSAPFVGARIPPSHRGNLHQMITPINLNLPPAVFFPDDDVALPVDHHTDMHLDTEDMSYEDLLELGEQIGNAESGLSEQTITNQLMTKTYRLPVNASEEEETDDLCVICQDEYKNKENIGILRCGHEYHADCLRRWLLEKNVCPMCKSVALTTGEKQ